MLVGKRSFYRTIYLRRQIPPVSILLGRHQEQVAAALSPYLPDNGLFAAVRRIQPASAFVLYDQYAALLQLDDEVGIGSFSRGLQPKRSLRLTGDIAYPGYAPDFWRQWQRRRQLLRRCPYRLH